MNQTYVCDGCGACCRTKLVDVYEVDFLREPKLGSRMLPVKDGFDGEVGFLNCLAEAGCPFLDGENHCSIYSTRPSVCVMFPAGGEDCQEARKSLGLPPLEPTPGKPTPIG